MKNLKSPLKKLLAVATFVGATSTAIAGPRTLSSGAPAPGNTVAKGVKKESVAVRAMKRAQEALAAALAEHAEATRYLASTPRVLANGAPACGNTGGKAPMCTAERAKEEYQARVERVRTAEREVKRLRAKLDEVTKKVAEQKQRSTYEDDYS